MKIAINEIIEAKMHQNDAKRENAAKSVQIAIMLHGQLAQVSLLVRHVTEACLKRSHSNPSLHQPVVKQLYRP